MDFYGPMDSRERFMERIAEARDSWANTGEGDLQAEFLELQLFVLLDIRELLRAQNDAAQMASEALNAMRTDPVMQDAYGGVVTPLEVIVRDGQATLPEREDFGPNGDATTPGFMTDPPAPRDDYGVDAFGVPVSERIEAARAEGRHLARRQLWAAIEQIFKD